MSVNTTRLVQYRARLEEQRTELLAQQQKVAADLAATAGAIQLADALLAESRGADQAETVEPTTTAEPEASAPNPTITRKRATRR